MTRRDPGGPGPLTTELGGSSDAHQSTPPARMTKAERADIGRMVRLTARVARDEVEVLQAARIADFEQELATTFDSDAEILADLLREAGQTVARLDAELGRRCQAQGIREEFRPKIVVGNTYRGENGLNGRRAELRTVARTRADADARAAKHRINAWEAETTRLLVATGLDTDEAQSFLASLPEPDQLMPALSLAELESDLDSKRGRR